MSNFIETLKAQVQATGEFEHPDYIMESLMAEYLKMSFEEFCAECLYAHSQGLSEFDTIPNLRDAEDYAISIMCDDQGSFHHLKPEIKALCI
jgi:hypothetical protein